MGHGVYIYISPLFRRVIFVMYTGTILFDCGDFMEQDAAGNGRFARGNFRKRARSFFFFFLQVRMKECGSYMHIFELFARSIFHEVCTNYGIFELLLLLLFYFYEVTLYHFSIQIYVTKIGEIQSYNVSKLIKIKSRIPLLFHYYSRLNNYKILTNYLIS